MGGLIPRPCRSSGCKQTTTHKSGYCPEHTSLVSGWSRGDRKGSTTSRGYGHKWRKLREARLKHDGYLCQSCKRSGRIKSAVTVDHIKAKAFGGSDAWDNLESLCDDCHKEKTSADARAGRFSKKAKPVKENPLDLLARRLQP
ncbi:HNH endonuclease [Endozoicomonas acroporae]|uniref:HNH endonuclease n=1 Tax=Endozoicomonas acroporae TaxID=1701104 RepID=UPI003D78D8AA